MLEVFFSYAHEDEALRDQLEKHLSLLKREGLIGGWYDRDISAGTAWKDAIDDHLESAQLILLLVSADFLASDYCYDIEMTRALARHESGEARVVPIILRPVDWNNAPFGKLQCLPKDAKPVTRWDDEDEAFLDIAKGIRKAILEISGRTPPHASVKPQDSQSTPKPIAPESVTGRATPIAPPLEETPPSVQKEKRAEPVLQRLAFNKLWLVVALVIAGIALSAPQYLADYREHVQTGRHYLHLGKMQDAKQEFEQGLDNHPAYMLANTLGASINQNIGQLVKQYTSSWVKTTEAYRGLEKAAVFDQGDLQIIDTKLKGLQQAYPNDADIQMLLGWFYAGQGRDKIDQAEGYYKKAIELDDKIAEAYFGLSYVYEVQGKFEAANSAAIKAVDLSDATPKYVINLANSYAELRQYQESLKHYASLSDDLAQPKVESARIYRITGKPDKAKQLLISAIVILNNPNLQKLPDNQVPWYFKTDRNAVHLNTLADKQYYTLASLLAVLKTLDQNDSVQDYTKQFEALKNVHRYALDELVEFDARNADTR